MNPSNRLEQYPAPGRRLIRHRGDVAEFVLKVPEGRAGEALLRTNIGYAAIGREEIIRDVEQHRPRLSRDWHDVPMRRVAADRFSVSLPLLEVGAFEAKACFVPRHGGDMVWPDGKNTWIKVEPADSFCGNTIYNAFVRQFGTDKFYAAASRGHEKDSKLLEDAGYSVIPPSGTFRDLIRELDFIVGVMHFRIIQLLPIHPVPTTFARMGRFGSPFAALDFYDVDPALAEFDRRTTPLDQLVELADAVHARGAKLFLDLPINHTGWASWLQVHHPEWFARDRDRSFQSPGAWGVTWEDLSRLNYRHRDLWHYMAGVFLFWCERGVDGFRCDAGYMVPLPVWEYIVAKVRREYPDTVFLLEGLGGKEETTASLLTRANLDWAYSEIFQNYDQSQIESYLPRAADVSSTAGLLVNFAETHDNPRLAAHSAEYARLRTAVAALLSQEGAFGIANGVEWLADKKVDVHGAPSLNWDSPANIVRHVARLNSILIANPCFHAGADLRFVHEGHFNTLALLRSSRDGKASVLVLVNLNETRPALVSWPASAAPFAPGELYDLVSGQKVAIEAHGDRLSFGLNAAQAACLTADPAAMEAVAAANGETAPARREIERRMLRAKALEIFRYYKSDAAPAEPEIDAMAESLRKDARTYCVESAAGTPKPAGAVLTNWEWPRDSRRTVPVPAGNVLCVTARYPFTATVRDSKRVLRREPALRQQDGTYVALILPPCRGVENHELTLDLAVYGRDHCHRTRSGILCMGAPRNAAVSCLVKGNQPDDGLHGLCTNRRGGMIQARAAWGYIASQYDAFLAANLHPDYPVDRRVMWTRCRAWLVYRDYSQDIDQSCQTSFASREDGSLCWTFSVPCGMGKLVALTVQLSMMPGHNTAVLSFRREAEHRRDEALEDSAPVRIIVRPDVEDRSFHEVTKAYLGPETAFPKAVSAGPAGFVFSPHEGHRLEMSATVGAFTAQPEWLYMVPHPVEAERGREGYSDLFSPGYFAFDLRAGDCATVRADALLPGSEAPPLPESEAPRAAAVRTLGDAARAALDHYLVRRDGSLTVIAGYPWFLDWGRDTLICLRGSIAAGLYEEARGILNQFARYEEGGTLPNMVRGDDRTNRDTSDAPLWFVVACRDLARALGTHDWLDSNCGGRSLRQVIVSIAESNMAGTANGVRMDPESGLIFSPAHFTWMDTNHPAGTAREGYPIEIQALWCAALDFLAEADPGGGWQDRAAMVRDSIARCFLNGKRRYLSDCLHATPGTAAGAAVPDDALRPNQLLAITLGAVEDRETRLAILSACEELLTPGAIRSLADREVEYELPIHDGYGRLLNDPRRPYWGTYRGDENGRRKPAYHNGTAWTWLFPSYCEAMYMTGGEACRSTALSLLSSAADLMSQGCIGHLPEIVDGDAPHLQRGCGAQAWGAGELYRVLAALQP